MDRALRRRTFVLGSLAVPASRAIAGAGEDRLGALVDGTARELLARHDLPGLAIGVSHAGRRQLFHYGVAARGSAAPVTASTLFELGSLTKPFTALLAAWAQELGRLSFEDSPGRWWPALRGTPLDRASLLHLATYTAGGLPLQFPDEVKDLADAAAFYRAFQPTARPGEQRRYSNPSIGLLGHVAALAMGRDFQELVEGDFLPRLGLRDAFLRVPAARDAAYAWGVNRSQQPTRVTPGVFDAQAYGLKATIGDLLRFVELQLDPAPLEPAMRRAVQATQGGRFAAGTLVQCLGWERYPFPVAREQLQAGNASTMALDPHPAQAVRDGAGTAPALFNKTGSTNGFGGYAAFVPATRSAVVLLANRNFPIPARIDAGHALLQHLAGA